MTLKINTVIKNWLAIHDYTLIKCVNIYIKIDGCEIVENQDNPIFISKFNGVPLKLSYSSEGAQIVLYLQYLIFNDSYKDKVVDITNCGGNAIKFILKYFNGYDLTLCLRHNQLGLDMECTFIVNGKEVSSLMEILNYEK